MASDSAIAQIQEICGCTDRIARQYLQLADDDAERATMLYFEHGGVDMNPAGATASSSATATATAQAQRPGSSAGGAIEIDSDDEQPAANTESDEALARRLQEEMYGGAGAGSRSGTGSGFEEDVRAPLARTTETLVEPEYPGFGLNGYGLDGGRRRRAPVGVFNQRSSSTIWNADPETSNTARGAGDARSGGRTGSGTSSGAHSTRASAGSSPARSTTGGGGARPRSRYTRDLLSGAASAVSSSSSPTTAGAAKLNRLAEMYKPPFEIMTELPWEDLRDEAREQAKWIMVNIQDPSVFDCQVLNRDIFRDARVRETLASSFVFAQYTLDDPRARTYLTYYFQDHASQDAYPYIAIVDPRTGELVRKWSGRPVPERNEFLMQLHEFLDQYSLSAWARNPVAAEVEKRTLEKQEAARSGRPAAVDFDRMTEEEQMEFAMRESLGGGAGAAGVTTTAAMTSMLNARRSTAASLRAQLPRFVKRLLKFPQMDFEMAIWEMTTLLVAPKKVFKSMYYHTKSTWHRPDPSFAYLLSFFMLLTALAWGLAYTPSAKAIAKLAASFILLHFLGSSLLVAAVMYLAVPRL
ncbi:hypothetical protein KEM52_001806, partial [Ascosphaera acerosa]